jgi:alkylhydroperoxidase family enzyme
MARVPYVEADSGGQVRRLFEDIERGRGTVLKLYRALANQPPALEAFMGMSLYVRDYSRVAPAMRELVILATAHALDEEYELAQHEALARKVGLEEAKISALRFENADLLEPREQAVVKYAFAITRTRSVRDDTFDALLVHFTISEIVDITLIIGWYHLCSVVIRGLGIELE